jgi:hypothetical protein
MQARGITGNIKIKRFITMAKKFLYVLILLSIGLKLSAQIVSSDSISQMKNLSEESTTSSLFLYRDYPKGMRHLGDFIKIKNVYCNFELLINLD